MSTPRVWERGLGHQGAGRLFRYCRRRGRFLYLVPNQALLRVRAGGLSAKQGRLETLAGFASRILEQAWPDHGVLAEQDRWILVGRSIEQVLASGELRTSQAIAQTNGYVATVASAIGRLKRAGWAPERLGGRPQEAELALIWQAYDVILSEQRFIDSADLPAKAAEALRAGLADGLLTDLDMAALEGFFGLTAGERAICEALAERLPEVWVEALGEPGEPLFAPVRAGVTGWPVGRPAAMQSRPTADPLIYLERTLFRQSPPSVEAPPLAPGRLTLLTGPGIEGEVVAVARALKALLLKQQVRPDQVGLIVPDPERYGQQLRPTFRRYGIPLQAASESVAAFPLGRSLLDLVGLATGEWSEGMLLRLLRSPYLADLFEGLPVAAGADWLAAAVCGWPPARSEAEWGARLEEAGAPDAGTADASAAAAHPAATIRAALHRLTALVAPLAQAAPVAALCTTLAEIIETTGIEQVVLAIARSAPQEAANLARVARELGALAALRRTLGRMARLYTVGGEGLTTRPAEFLHLLERELERESHRTDPKAPGPGVQLLGPGQSYGRRFAVVAVMGLAEGLFPRAPESDFLLPLQRREALGLPGFDEHLARERLLYLTAITRSERFLLLSSPSAGEGEEFLRSSFLDETLDLLGGELPVTALGAEAIRPEAAESVWSEAEARLWAASQEPVWVSPAAPFADPGALALLAQQFPPERPLGISRVQSQAHCGFRNLGDLLGLEPWERWQPGPDALERGALRHRILAAFWRGWSGPLTQAQADAAAAHLQQILDRELTAVSSPFEQAATRRWAEAWLQGEIALQEAGNGLRPRWLELGFGMAPSEERDPDSIAAPLKLTTAAGEAQFRGIIDRVDVAADDSAFLVYDYKGGASNYEAAQKVDLAFQPPLYALAVRHGLLPTAQVAGVGYYLSGKGQSGKPKRIALFQEAWAPPRSRSGLTAEAMEARLQAVANQAVLAAVRLRQGDFRPAPKLPCPEYCPLRYGCRSYEPNPPQRIEQGGGSTDAE